VPLFLAALLRQFRLKLLSRRKGTVRLLAAWIVLMMALHVAAMMAIEGMPIGDALWVTVITATTVGYGDVSAKTGPGRLATIVFMLVGTIFVLGTMASLFFERAAEKRELKSRGRYRWNLDMHLLLISTTGREPVKYLVRLVGQLRQDPRWSDRPILILTHGFDSTGLPADLHALGVVHYSGDGDTTDELNAARLDAASQVVVLGDPNDSKADAYVFDVVTRVRASGYTGPIVSECVDDRNRERLRTRADDVALRPIRGYPEFLARAVLAPGAERLIEELLSAEGDECVAVGLGGPRRAVWRDLVVRMLDADLGTIVGYKLGDAVATAPRARDEVEFDTLFVVVRGHAQQDCVGRIRSLLDVETGAAIEPSITGSMRPARS
jgi:voltage-gated potassium channel